MANEKERARLEATIAQAKLDQGHVTLADLLIMIERLENEGGDSAPLKEKAKKLEARMSDWSHARDEYVARADGALSATARPRQEATKNQKGET